tara:strand:- start:74 stop:490 length:417 start_codon:yes stop_codon:yes gene_type:complete
MTLSKVHKWEKAVVLLLNSNGWELEWSGKGYSRYDAIGKTPKGYPCVIEFKFRQKYYETKMLEKDKYDALMRIDENIIKIYYVFDPKGNFLYYLNTIKLPEPIKKYLPDTTIWSKKKRLKYVYLLQENDAVRIDLNNE